MSTTDLLNRWSALSWREIQAELIEEQDSEDVQQLYGVEEAAELRAATAVRSLRAQREAVIFLPGLMGSLLSSIRGITELLWINPALILKGQTSWLELDQRGADDDNPRIHSMATSIEKLSYLKGLITLGRETELYEFPYDWRKPMESNADLLHDFIERWAEGNAAKQFTLVGHSMGGIVSRAYLARHRDSAKQRVKRLIMHGTPHFGAAGAVADLMLGNRMMAVAARLNDNNRLRNLVLNMPSAYQLLPAPPDLFPADRAYPANWDLYDAKAWRLDGIRQDYLDAGRRFHELLADFDHPVEVHEIAGCHLETIVDVERSFDERGKPHLRIIRVDEGSDSGDATVPLWSARLPGASIYYVQHKHRYLSRHAPVLEATIALTYGDTPDLPTELPPKETGLFGFRAVATPEQEAADLRARLEAGTASEEDLELLYFMGM